MKSVRPGEPIQIAGAGLSGLSAAISLRDRGFEVEVFEKHQSLGSRFPGSLQILDNFTYPGDSLDELRRLGVLPSFVRHPFFGSRFFTRTRSGDDPGAHRYCDLTGDRPYGYCVRRGAEPGCLDFELARQAEGRGARIRFGTFLDPESADIVATGPREADGIAAELHFSTGGSDRLETLWDEEIFPGGGYSYRIVSQGRGILAIALIGAADRPRGRYDDRLERSWDFFQRRDPIPMVRGRVQWSRVNFYLCDFARAAKPLPGEAGGLIDYTAGFGIRAAIVSGYLAGVSLAEGLPFERLIRRRFGRSLRGAIVTRALIERFGFGPFLRIAAHSDFRRFIARFAGPGRFRAFLAPLAQRALGRADRCHHTGPCTWCRPRSVSSGAD